MVIVAVNSAHMDVINRDRIAHRPRLRNVICPRSAFGFCTVCRFGSSDRRRYRLVFDLDGDRDEPVVLFRTDTPPYF